MARIESYSSGNARFVKKAGDTMTGNLNMGTKILIGGTGVTDILKLQATTGNGTAGSAAIQLLTGNNGATTALTVLNNGNVGMGTTSPVAKLQVDTVAAGTIGQIIRGASAQTADLQQWNSSAATLLQVKSNGVLQSSVATGTAPLIVASTTKVTNLNADLLDGYDSSVVYKDGDVVTHNNGFGGRKLYNNQINDAFYLADKRWPITAKWYDIATGTEQGTFTALQVSYLFNGNFEDSLQVPANCYALITIDFSLESSGYFPGYPYGDVIVSQYYTYFPDATVTANDTVRTYSNYAPHGIGWHSYSFVDVLRNTSLITKARNDVYSISSMEIKLNAGASNRWVCNIEMNLDRPGSVNPMPYVDKGKDNSLYGNLNFDSTYNKRTLTLEAATGKVSTKYGYDISRVAAPATLTVALIASAGNVNAGTHYYHVTYVTALGETNAKVSSVITTDAGNGQVTVTIPTSTDTRVTARKIYRTKAGEPSYGIGGLLTTINDNTTTTYVDNKTDASLTGSGAYWRENTTSKFITMDGTIALFPGITSLFAGTNAGLTTQQGTTTGGYNVGVGTSALQNLTSGVQNVGVGFAVMASVTSGGDNVGIGYGPNTSLTTGSYNVAIGRNAQLYNQTGSLNVAIGQGALTGAAGNSNSANTAIGTTSLSAVTTGNYNIGIGYYAGAYSTTQSSELFINSLPRTNRAGDVANSIIYGVQSATPANQILALGGGGKVGINETAPGAMLQITSNAAATIGQIIKGAAAQTADLLQIQNSSTDKIMVVSSGGRVGIGTANPSVLLHVRGALYSASFPANVEIEDSAAMAQDVGGGFVFSGNDGTTGGRWWAGIRGAKENATSGNYAGYVSILTRTSGVASMTERMRVSSAGNVGIGTTAPSEKLDVSGTVKATGYKSSDGSAGVSGSFTTTDGKTITIKDGLVTSIV